MKPEQRLLLALGLTLGILLSWTMLLPPSQQPPATNTQLNGNKVIRKIDRLAEPLFSVENGPFKLGIGTQRGGIQTVRVEGSDLLVSANPGLFQVERIESSETPLQFESRWESGTLLSTSDLTSQGSRIIRQISIPGDSHNYLLECKLKLSNESKTTQEYQLRIVTYLPLHLPISSDQRYQDGIVSIDGKIQHIRLKPNQILRFSGSPAWITAQGKSYALILQPRVPLGMFHVEHSSSGVPVGWLTLPPVELAPGGQSQWDFKLYAGPMSLESLKKAGLEETISFGAFSGIAKFLFGILRWNQGWMKNYGLAIVLLGFLIWSLFFPVTWSGIRMTKVMAKLQPQMERIRKEYGKDPQRMNQEMMRLYKKNRVNPLSGCLPLLFQMPIFIALFQVLSRSPELRGATFLWIRDLSAPDALIHFPSTIPLLGNSLNLLPILMMGGMFLQQRMNKTPETTLTEEQAMQQGFMRWFPLLFGFLFYSLPSGLVLYWVTNTTLTLGQYLLYFRLHTE
ncbi:MAG: YidC/Oxa1 family insertase periplasmic-domain containing protein [Candidatus Omnitrophica bacterium]|nr:YidC/Oxa1 family insertase periplasmic-domain containing protein [Candidatus Omnitrophota bacterium]